MPPATSDDSDERLRALERQFRRLREDHARLEQRLSQVENSLIFRTLRGAGALAAAYRQRAGQALLRSPFHSLYLRVRPPLPDRSYQAWVSRHPVPIPGSDTSPGPLISVVMATHRPRREWLEEAVASVQAQSYPRWELCVCDDASADAWVREFLDVRSRFVAAPEHQGISATLNQAASLATGDYLAFLDHDDRLAPGALSAIVQTLRQGPVDLLYTDEDHLDGEGHRCRPNLKPGWSPDLLLGCMYCGHLLVVRRDRFTAVGGFRSNYDGAQDYDLALRLTDQPATVRHVPGIHYHWREHAGSTALRAAAKPHAQQAGHAALQDALGRRGIAATVSSGPIAHSYRVERPVASEPLVSVIVVSRQPALLRRCLHSLNTTTAYARREVVAVLHQHPEPNAEIARVADEARATTVAYPHPFNYAAMNNQGAAAARGEVLLFLNDDVQPLAPDWLTHLLAHAQRPEIGAVGAQLLYPEGTIQHAGIMLGMMEGTGHVGRGQIRSDLWPWLELTRNVSAVTGACLMVRRDVFTQVSGFDTGFPVNYNDVDLCLRVRQAGYEVLVEPRAVLRHDECRTRRPGTQGEERERFWERWGAELEASDPYLNPLVRRDREAAEFAADGPASGVGAGGE